MSKNYFIDHQREDRIGFQEVVFGASKSTEQLDAIVKDDPNARVACETAITTGLILVMGEITTSTYVDIAEIARQEIEIQRAETIQRIVQGAEQPGLDCFVRARRPG